MIYLVLLVKTYFIRMNKFDIYLIRNDVKEEPYISSIVNQLYH